MTPQYILFIAAPILLALGAFIGLFLARRRFEVRVRPLPLAMAHLALGLLGTCSIFTGLALDTAPRYAYLAASLVGLTAFGGLALLTFRLRGMEPPKTLIIMHASAAFLAISSAIVVAVNLGH